MKKLAILDYGIGGLDIYSRLKKINPNFPITYFSDSGAVPYGKLDEDSLTLRLQTVINWLKNTGVEQLVIACHSASTVAHRLNGIPFINMIAATKETILQNASTIQKLGIIGGGRTIDSAIYRNYAQELKLDVVDHNAQIFSIMIENDLTHSAEFNEHLDAVLSPLQRVEGLLLACTHYPLIQEQLRSYFAHEVRILDPIDQMLKIHFKNLDEERYENNTDILYTTGNNKLTNKLARDLFGLKHYRIEQAKI